MEEQDFLLLKLPSEVTEPIYNYCFMGDLINLACCNKSLHNSIKYLLWRDIALPWKYLKKQPIPARQLNNLKHTVNLCFSNKNQFVDAVSWKSVATNFENVFHYCDSHRLSAIIIHGVVNDRGIQLMLRLLETEEVNEVGTHSRQRAYSMSRLFRGFRLPNMLRSDLTLDKPGKSHENLKELHLFHCISITDLSLNLVGSLLGLKKLSISHNHMISSAGFLHIGKLQQLLELNLESTSIENEFLVHISISLPQLQKLNISRCNSVDDSGVSHISNLMNLESLDVSWCTKITDNSFLGMEKVPLVSLKVQGCSLITDQGMATFANGNIHEINIGCTNISDIGLHYLQNNILIKRLTANGCNQISDDGLRVLGGIPSLREMDLSGRTSITDEGLAYISALTSLQRFKIQNCPQLTDLGLYYISSLKSLVELNISGCVNVTDLGIFYLQKLNMLEHLNMNGCHVTERGLAHLRGLGSLKLLSIMNMRSAVEPIVHDEAEDQQVHTGH